MKPSVSVVEATLWPTIQRATLEIVGRAFGRGVSARAIAAELWHW